MMTTIDLLAPQPRPVVTGHAGIADLIEGFNAMLDRLEAERATSTALALRAQEAERRRVAQELHDEVGQTLTAVLLELTQAARHAPAPVAAQLAQVQETTRGSLDEIRRIARRLRPGVLEELGLISALRSLIAEITGHTALQVTRDLSRTLPALSGDIELVIYRVAQEALTNIVRHSDATTAAITLTHSPGQVQLVVSDNGSGTGQAPEGAGIRGMRERALLIGATLAITSTTAGTQVRLSVPVDAGQP
jgi:two-component system sensor histidine kinase UhpB